MATGMMDKIVPDEIVPGNFLASWDRRLPERARTSLFKQRKAGSVFWLSLAQFCRVVWASAL